MPRIRVKSITQHGGPIIVLFLEIFRIRRNGANAISYVLESPITPQKIRMWIHDLHPTKPCLETLAQKQVLNLFLSSPGPGEPTKLAGIHTMRQVILQMSHRPMASIGSRSSMGDFMRPTKDLTSRHLVVIKELLMQTMRINHIKE